MSRYSRGNDCIPLFLSCVDQKERATIGWQSTSSLLAVRDANLRRRVLRRSSFPGNPRIRMVWLMNAHPWLYLVAHLFNFVLLVLLSPLNVDAQVQEQRRCRVLITRDYSSLHTGSSYQVQFHQVLLPQLQVLAQVLIQVRDASTIRCGLCLKILSSSLNPF